MIYISFEPENAAAKALYESLGFVPDGQNRIRRGRLQAGETGRISSFPPLFF